jgi:thiol-disulfide isomerase/thioredoxin
MPLKIHRTKLVVACLAAACLLVTHVHAGELSKAPAISPSAFNLPDLAGKERTLAEFSGQVVLVNFWASWCIPCLEEMPAILRLKQLMNSQPFSVVAINVGEASYPVETAARQMQLDFPVLLDGDKSVFKSWNAKVLPATYILDRSGQVRYIGRGPIEWDRPDIVEILKALVSS